ncbi:MAG TPA: hypothetical protein EYG27_09260 [Dehalococcoidia bacterium]|jgi:hypothetical protein|nr:hypothetical protein [Dehalococcoidia bacterium]
MATTAQHQTYWERAKESGFDLSWLSKLEENVVGAEVEDVSDNLTGRVAGSIPRPGVAKFGAYPFRTKKEVWGYNLTKLYEEFVSRQWSSATDIPWDTLEELPDDIEAAECQLATFFAQVEFVAADVPGRFIATMSSDYQEVRRVLLGQVMDESRHLEVFRKRALANGGGLMRMIDSVSDVVGGSTDSAREYTELSTRLHIVGEGNVLTLFRLGELMAYNEAEKTIYRRCAQDEARHVAIGVLHARYMKECAPERVEEMHSYLDEAENRQSSGAGGENPAARNMLTSEALAVLLGGGKDKTDEGQKILMAVRQKQVKEYFQRLKSAGLDDRITNGRVNPALLNTYNPNPD